MMKRLLLLSLFCAIGTVGFAQLELEPNPVIVSDLASDAFEGVAYSTITNKLPQLKTYRWVRTNIEITDGWETAVCDKNQCYLPQVDSMDFELAFNEEGTMDVHAYPNGNDGMAIAEVIIFDPNDPETSVTGVYYFNATPNSVSEQEVAQLRVYPNPTQGIFTLSNRQVASDIQIFNMTGQMVRHFKAGNEDNYDIRNLPNGAYTIRLLDEGGRTLTTRLIQKQ